MPRALEVAADVLSFEFNFFFAYAHKQELYLMGHTVWWEIATFLLPSNLLTLNVIEMDLFSNLSPGVSLIIWIRYSSFFTSCILYSNANPLTLMKGGHDSEVVVGRPVSFWGTSCRTPIKLDDHQLSFGRAVLRRWNFPYSLALSGSEAVWCFQDQIRAGDRNFTLV